jgi:predicted nuclease of predicted toxin-antitoxin system
VRYYLDEMLPPILAPMLRLQGVDTISALDILPARTPDRVHLAVAASENRCLVTKDLRDFGRLTEEFMAQGRPHAGVLLVPPTIRSRDFAPLRDALLAFAELYPDGLPPYTLAWLPPRRR